jgi:hypothetical protein
VRDGGRTKEPLAPAARTGMVHMLMGCIDFYKYSSKKQHKDQKNHKIKKKHKNQKIKDKNIRNERKTQLKPMTQPPPFCSRLLLSG